MRPMCIGRSRYLLACCSAQALQRRKPAEIDREEGDEDRDDDRQETARSRRVHARRLAAPAVTRAGVARRLRWWHEPGRAAEIRGGIAYRFRRVRSLAHSISLLDDDEQAARLDRLSFGDQTRP